jgi:hypothetical protein
VPPSTALPVGGNVGRRERNASLATPQRHRRASVPSDHGPKPRRSAFR